MRLSDAQQGFFIAEVDLDIPAPDIGLKDLLEREVGVGADEEGRLSVEESAHFGQAIVQGSDDDEAEVEGSGGSPAQGAHGLEVKVVPLVGGIDVTRLPGDGFVLAELFGGRQWRPVEAGSALAWGLRVGRGVKFGVLADAADGGDVLGQVFEQDAVGEAAVEQQADGPGCGLAQLGQPVEGIAVDGSLAGLFLVMLKFLRGRLAGGFGRWRGHEEIDGDHAGLAGCAGQGGREFKDALAADEVGPKGRAEWMAAPSDAGDLGSGLGDEGIIQGHDQGLVFSQIAFHFAARHLKELLFVNPVAFEEPVVGAPIFKLTAGGRDPGAERMPPQAGQVTQEKASGPFGVAALGEGRFARCKQVEEGA